MPIPEAGRPFLRRQFFPDTVKAFMPEKEQTCPFLLQNKENHIYCLPGMKILRFYTCQAICDDSMMNNIFQAIIQHNSIFLRNSIGFIRQHF